MDKPENRKDPPAVKTDNRHSRHARHTRHKTTGLKSIAKWVKKNPLKIAASLFIGAIIYISVLFYNYEEGNVIKNENVVNNKIVRGILVPMRILSEMSTVSVDFGKTKNSVSLQQLKQGYEISPTGIGHCANDMNLSKPSKFIIYLVEDRLYVTTNFIGISDDSIIGSVNKKDWTFLSKNISAIRTDDYSFEVSDSRRNVIFNMQFIEPDILSIHGYFIGAECIYIVNDNGIYSDTKTGNYIERALPEIKKIKRIM